VQRVGRGEKKGMLWKRESIQCEMKKEAANLQNRHREHISI
jgi:hypothetical protein